MNAIGLRLSPWHMEIAKLFGEGKSNREIREVIQISDSRLSVLKHNPVFAREIEKWRKKHEEKYAKAMEVIAQNAEKVAQEMVNVATGINTPFSVKAQVGNQLLDRLSQWEGSDSRGANVGEEVTFEQLLRVTKKSNGSGSTDIIDEKSSYDELLQDIKPVEMCELENEQESESLEPADSEREEPKLESTEDSAKLASPAPDLDSTSAQNAQTPRASASSRGLDSHSCAPIPHLQALSAQIRPSASTRVIGSNGGAAHKPYEISDEMKQLLGVH
jgi:hypothetical protein